MKKNVVLLIAVAFAALCLNVFGQNTHTFDVKISGQGKQSIIFIPGFACSGEVWDATRSMYEQNYTCYTLTMSGFAGAAAQPSPTFKKWEESIASYITEKKINNPIIIGHSMGGGLALALAADYPDLISKIIVVDAVPCLAAMNNPEFKSLDTPDCGRMISYITTLSDDQFYQTQKRTMPALLADSSKLEKVVSWSVKSDRTTFASMYCDFSNTDLRKKISTIKCPSLILLEAPFSNDKSTVSKQYENLKSADLRYSTKGLHFIMYDDKNWYEAQLRSFLK